MDAVAATGDASDTTTGDAAAPVTGDAASASEKGDAAAPEQLPAPSGYDKTEFCEDAATASLLSARTGASSSLASVNVSAEMKYFTRYESHSNYRQGFGAGDGCNALGYYQFDRRYALIPFLTAVHGTDPSKYAMLRPVIDCGGEVKGASSLCDDGAGTLTELGQMVQSAWYVAYDADPAAFSAFQDAYAYNSYYVPTESWLKCELGIDMSGRADCVKGMVWGLSNLWGTGGVKKIMRGAGLSNSMSDAEFVTALATQMTDNIARYSSQTRYYKGWANRYRNELSDCLAYLSLHGDTAGEGTAATPENDGAGDAAADAGSRGSTGTVGGLVAPSAPAPSPSPAPDNGVLGGGTPGDGCVTDAAAGGDGEETGEIAGTADASGNGNGRDLNALGGEVETGETASDGTAGAGEQQEGGAGSDGDVTSGDTPGDAPSEQVSSNAGVTPGASDESPAGSSTEEQDGDSSTADEQTPDGDEREREKTEMSDEGDSQTKMTSADDDGTGDAGDNVRIAGDNGGGAGSGGDGSGSGAEGDSNGTAPAPQNGANDATRLPRTSDVALFVGFAGASTATFGATFVYAGKTGLIKRRDRKTE